MNTLLETTALRAGYAAREVLYGIDLSVGFGEIVVVLGANGAGKTTTMRAISGMIPVSGALTLDGDSVANARPEEMVRRGVAHVPQGRGTFMGLTVDENLRLGGYVTPRKVAHNLERSYDSFPQLADRRQQTAGSMSGGEQQMLAVARALMSDPRLLLLDEPSLGLAPQITASLFNQLQEINAVQGTAMLIVEQNAALALRSASRAYVLETGKFVVSGSAQDVLEDEGLRRAYLGY